MAKISACIKHGGKVTQATALYWQIPTRNMVEGITPYFPTFPAAYNDGGRISPVPERSSHGMVEGFPPSRFVLNAFCHNVGGISPHGTANPSHQS
jgi:hypothetical protein